jgi:murein DD-endopeptidase MepM/ murein hydrolase activator NlpD
MRSALTLLLYATALLSALAIRPAPAYAAPQLSLPTPPGETWKIIQGYGCGTHNAWDRYSLDLASADGRTYGAPVRAAADGRIWVWVPKSGTLILDHGDGFYTMYTHMASAATTAKDTFVARGTVIGAVGDRGAPGTPHLHFTAFTGHGIAASGRKSVELSFAEGYNLPDVGGCNQHGGEKLVAGGHFSADSGAVSFRSEAQAQTWYNADKRVEFNLPAGSRGFSQAWDQAPAADAPQFVGADAGYLQLAAAGEGLHTVQLRVWDADGQASEASYGPIGYDVTPPAPVAPIAPVEAPAGKPALLRWAAPADNGAGVAGYRIYIGPDENGISDWFASTPETETPTLEAGRYLLRVQPIDYAGNAGTWATIGEIDVAE